MNYYFTYNEGKWQLSCNYRYKLPYGRLKSATLMWSPLICLKTNSQIKV